MPWEENDGKPESPQILAPAFTSLETFGKLLMLNAS